MGPRDLVRSASVLAESGPDPLLSGLALLVTALCGGWAVVYGARRAARTPPVVAVPAIPGPDAAEVWVATFAQLNEAAEQRDAANARVAELEQLLEAKDAELTAANAERLNLLRRLAGGDTK